MLFVVVMCIICLFFFFKQKTAYEVRISDWSSDVCSSDLSPKCFYIDVFDFNGQHIRALAEMINVVVIIERSYLEIMTIRTTGSVVIGVQNVDFYAKVHG